MATFDSLCLLCILPMVSIFYVKALDFKYNSSYVTVSGGSSGACVAVQYGVVYSSRVQGIGILAGVPYYCAHYYLNPVGDLSCTIDPSAINTDKLASDAVQFGNEGKIDDTSNMKDMQIFLFSGKDDTVVPTEDVIKAGQFFDQFLINTTKQTYFESNISAEHAMVTDDWGNPCKRLGEPFINNCGYDLAETLLEWLYDSKLNPREENYPYNNVIGIDQQQFIPNGKKASSISMEEIAYAYKPSNCTVHPLSENCRVHILYHGCLQNLNTYYVHSGGDKFNDTLVRHAGFNQWAETNNLVILYPQASYSAVDPVNPEGCWDWWGYTGPAYAWNTGPQMETVHNMVEWIINP